MNARARWAEVRKWLHSRDGEDVVQGMYDGSLGLDGYGDVLDDFGLSNTPANRSAFRRLPDEEEDIR